MTPESRWQALRDHLTTEIALDVELARAWYGTDSGDEAAARAETNRRTLAKMTELEAGAVTARGWHDEVMAEMAGETRPPAAELREAARLMRERAGDVPPPPWYVGTYDVTTGDGSNVIASSGLTVRSQYVASWHPGVALAAAALLEAVAVVIGDSPGDDELPAACQRAVEFARVYLGSAGA